MHYTGSRRPVRVRDVVYLEFSIFTISPPSVTVSVIIAIAYAFPMSYVCVFGGCIARFHIDLAPA